MSFGILGPLTVWRDGVPLVLPGLRHREVLARLLMARARVVSVDQLIVDLWADDSPHQPVASIQSFVYRWRRLLEPDREPRSLGSLLVTTNPGYALRPEADQVDAWRFERLVRDAAANLVANPAAARETLDAALELWRGPAFQEFTERGWAAAECARLEELRLQAVEYRADAGLRLGLAQSVITEIAAQVEAHPLREQSWALLAAGQYGAGRQGDALASLRRARAVLADELGVDPGPALRALELDILRQAEHLPQLPVVPPPAVTAADGDVFVGRKSELDQLVALADLGGVALLVGDAGMGKTALLGQLAARLSQRGWLVGLGRCADRGAVLPGWPWAEAIRALARTSPPPDATAEGLGWLLRDDSPLDPDPLVGQHRTRVALRDYLVGLSNERPLLLALDDLHQADEETLAVLTSLVADLAGRRAFIVATRRGFEGSPALDEAIAVLARHAPSRLSLAGLDPAAVGAILAERAANLAPDQVLALTERTGGNPFFVRETARLLNDEGLDVALTVVPAGVQEVLGYRISRLPIPTQNVLAYAAVLGGEIDLSVLIELAGEPEGVVLDAVEAALDVGLLLEPRAGGLTFPHALVRDLLYERASRARRSRMHARAAAALVHRHPDDVTAIAHHLERAADRGLATSTLRYARLAAIEAERRYAYREASRLWQLALAAADELPSQPVERLDLLLSQVRSLALAGDGMAARALRSQTLAQADAINDPVLAAAAVASFDVPTLWTSHPYGEVDVEVVDRSERILRDLPAGDSEPRCRMLISLALELEGEADERGLAAAREAEAMARRLGDPPLLVMALNAFLLEHYWPGGHDERRRVGGELLQLGQDIDLVAAKVLGRMTLIQTHAAAGEFEEADRQVAEVESLARAYEQPRTTAIAACYYGVRELVNGDLDAALGAYARAAALVAEVGMWQGDGDLVAMTTGCAWLSVGRIAELADQWDGNSVGARSYPELFALALARAGRREEAKAWAGAPRPIRRDYAFDVHWAARGLLGIAIDDGERVREAYRELAPYPHLVAGAGTAVVVVEPIAEILGDLAAHLGDRAAAAEHYRQAVVVARRAGAQHWQRRAAERV